MALNLCVPKTAKKSNPIALLDPSATATCRAKFKNARRHCGTGHRGQQGYLRADRYMRWESSEKWQNM
ncbi:hypothetical protein L6164_035276 [Bauhinia variegata]|uniref:Uncharacterized protein n=1 Tax=Bauhinia variegata TaxID=167791 RepID=A0ACB9KXN6_BAUVA|nr:hypothetical protein L6164_035276 [Bauhinia variegata]